MSDQNSPLPDPSPPPRPAAPAPPEWRAGAGPTAPSGAPSGSTSWWTRATSTGGGRAALVGVAVLGVLFLVAGLGLATALVLGHGRGDRGSAVDRPGMGQDMGPGRGQGNANGRKNGNGKKNGQGNNGNGNQGNGRGQAQDDQDGDMPFGPAKPGNPGMGQGRGAAGLGAVLHGEFTTSVTGTPTVMVVQTGQVTAYTAGKSLTVKSADGYQATYTLDATTSTIGGNGTQPATGVQVRVLAAKEGMKVTTLVVGG